MCIYHHLHDIVLFPEIPLHGISPRDIPSLLHDPIQYIPLGYTPPPPVRLF